VSIDEYMGKEKPPKDDVIIIVQDGGIGDTIASTVMIESARKIYRDRKLVLGTFYPDVFLNNPNVDVLYATHQSDGIYEKWIKKIRYNSSLLKVDLYNSGIHKIFPGKLSEAYCYYYNVPYSGDNPKIYLTDDENEKAKVFLSSFPRDVILIHPCAGKVNYDPKRKLTENKDWFKDYWKKLVEKLNKEFDIVQLGGPMEEEIEGVTTYLMGHTNIRQTMALVKNALTFIGIDSFVGHVGPAVDKTGVVLFGRSNPYIFGHDSNVNVWVDNSCELNDMFCGRPQSYWGDSELFRGVVRSWTCPNRSCMKAITPEIVYKKVFEAIEINTRKNNK
jgi:ADP-heptose:LPS heptosyltransferase